MKRSPLIITMLFLLSLIGLVLTGPAPDPSITPPPVASPAPPVETLPPGEETAPEPEDYLAGMFVYGGMCPEGECQSGYLITESGTVLNGTADLTVVGNASESDLANLKSLMETEISPDMELRPFTETCPIAYDGVAFVFYFYDDEGMAELDSCEFDVSELQSAALVQSIITKAIQDASTTDI